MEDLKSLIKEHQAKHEDNLADLEEKMKGYYEDSDGEFWRKSAADYIWSTVLFDIAGKINVSRIEM